MSCWIRYHIYNKCHQIPSINFDECFSSIGTRNEAPRVNNQDIIYEVIGFGRPVFDYYLWRVISVDPSKVRASTGEEWPRYVIGGEGCSLIPPHCLVEQEFVSLRRDLEIWGDGFHKLKDSFPYARRLMLLSQGPAICSMEEAYAAMELFFAEFITIHTFVPEIYRERAKIRLFMGMVEQARVDMIQAREMFDSKLKHRDRDEMALMLANSVQMLTSKAPLEDLSLRRKQVIDQLKSRDQSYRAELTEIQNSIANMILLSSSKTHPPGTSELTPAQASYPEIVPLSHADNCLASADPSMPEPIVSATPGAAPAAIALSREAEDQHEQYCVEPVPSVEASIFSVQGDLDEDNASPKDSEPSDLCSDAVQITDIVTPAELESAESTSIFDELCRIYEGRCAITRLPLKQALKTARLNVADSSVSCAILLRSDLADLLEANLIAIDPLSMRTKISSKLANTPYVHLQDMPVFTPRMGCDRPDINLMRQKYCEFLNQE